MAIRTIIIDDHPVFLEGMTLALGVKQGIDIIGGALSGSEGAALVAERVPDVVILDYLLPDLTAPQVLLSVAPQLKSGVVAVVLTASDEPEYVEASFAAGAAAFLRKELSVDELYNAILLVMHGYQIFPSTAGLTARPFLDALRSLREDVGLTSGEADVLAKMVSGKSNQEISRIRGVSPQTIKNQTTSLYRKLGVASRSEAILRAVRAGLVPPE